MCCEWRVYCVRVWLLPIYGGVNTNNYILHVSMRVNVLRPLILFFSSLDDFSLTAFHRIYIYPKPIFLFVFCLSLLCCLLFWPDCVGNLKFDIVQKFQWPKKTIRNYCFFLSDAVEMVTLFAPLFVHYLLPTSAFDNNYDGMMPHDFYHFSWRMNPLNMPNML